MFDVIQWDVKLIIIGNKEQKFFWASAAHSHIIIHIPHMPLMNGLRVIKFCYVLPIGYFMCMNQNL